MQQKIRVDFHTHTRYSPDSLTDIDTLILTARRRGLDRIAITDHNTIQGALEAFRKYPEFVVVGEEIQTTKGELLAFYVKEEVPAGLPPLEAIERLRMQEAFISVSHPFDPYRSGWSLDDLQQIAAHVDGIEVFNARCFTSNMNQQALAFARLHDLRSTAGSDAHWHGEVGNASVRLPVFSNAGELRTASEQGEIQGKLTPFWVRLISSFARLVRL